MTPTPSLKENFGLNYSTKLQDELKKDEIGDEMQKQLLGASTHFVGPVETMDEIKGTLGQLMGMIETVLEIMGNF